MLKQMFHLRAWRMGQARSAAILKIPANRRQYTRPRGACQR